MPSSSIYYANAVDFWRGFEVKVEVEIEIEVEIELQCFNEQLPYLYLLFFLINLSQS
jgi:hypothetical protein